MDDTELFDVFSLDNNPEPEQKTVFVPVTEDLKKSRSSTLLPKGLAGKRRHEVADGAVDEPNGSPFPSVSKKAKKSAEDPIVVDSFETESEQVVPATQGLQGNAPLDDKIVIKKRVTFTKQVKFNF